MKPFIIISLNFFALAGWSQVQVDHSIQLTGTGSNAKVTGIEEVNGAEDATSAESIQKNAVTYASATNSGNAYSVSLVPAPASYTTGMIVHFKASADVSGPASLNINGLGAAAIKKNYNADLSANDIKNGQMVSVMYDGTNFQMLSQTGAAPSSGLTAENSSNSATWISSNSSNAWEDITALTHTVGQSGRYLIAASFESIDGTGGTNQNIRINANGVLSSRVSVGPNIGTWQYFTITHLVNLSAGNVVKLQNQNDWNYCCKNQVRNITFSLIKVQ